MSTHNADYGRPEKLISKAKFLLGDSTLHADDEANLHVIALALTAIADMMAKTKGTLIDGNVGITPGTETPLPRSQSPTEQS